MTSRQLGTEEEWRAVAYYALLDRVPLGRNERDGATLWPRRHDEY